MLLGDEHSPPPAKDPWPAEPGFAPVAVAEPPADGPGVWAAAAEPIDVTDATIDMPALAPVRGRHAARARSAVLTLAVVLACAGAAVAPSGVLKANHDKTPPVATGSSSAIATARPHAKPAHHQRVVHHRRHRRHHARRHRTAVAPRQLVAAAPVRTTSATTPARAPVRPVVRRPASRPAPKPAPKPVATKPATTPQPAPSAPSGEPGRQPAPQP